MFAEDDRLLDDAFIRRSDRFIRELIWMSKVLRYGREHASIDEEAAEIVMMPCPNCGAAMTHHADKVVPAAATSDADVVMAASHACSDCGGQGVRNGQRVLITAETAPRHLVPGFQAGHEHYPLG